MKKWILIGSGAVVVIIIVLVVVGVSNLGPMIKNAVNTHGPKITKTDVRLGDVGVSIFSAEAKLKDFYLGNPKGFKSPQAMNVKAIYVDVDEKSLTGDAIIIDKIEVVAPEITYEKIRGTDNFKTILNNVKSSVGAGEPSKKGSGEEGEGRKIIIRNFIVRDGKVNLAMAMLGGKSLSASLPDIHLRDIGKKKGGASPAEAFKEVFAELHEKITSPSVNDTLNKGLKALGIGVKEVGEGAKKGVETVTDKVKGLLGK
jgi:uncharacterized protein involved in outer membrane biogenesis